MHGIKHRKSLKNTILLICLVMAPLLGAATRATPKAGEIPPDALGKDRTGVEQTISLHRGKVVIVTFWASWCAPCRRELPVLGKFQRAVGKDALEVIAINYKEPKADFQNVVRANADLGLTWVHDKSGATSAHYGVTTLPNMFIIDRDGRVAHVHHGYSDDSLPMFIREITALLPAEVLQRPAKN